MCVWNHLFYFLPLGIPYAIGTLLIDSFIVHNHVHLDVGRRDAMFLRPSYVIFGIFDFFYGITGDGRIKKNNNNIEGVIGTHICVI